MAQTVKDVEELRSYLSGVMNRAEHHANGVDEITLALVGAILWRKDDDSIKVMVREGQTANVLWVAIGGRRFALSYNHTSGKIEMREGSIQGQTLHEFDNTTSLSSLKSIFAAL
jgi:hypothetical protein